MTDLPDPVVLTEDELLAAFAGGQPEQLFMRNLIHTMFALVGSDITSESLKTALSELSGTFQIGNDSNAHINLAGEVTVIDSWGMNLTGNLNITGGGELASDGPITGTDIAGGTILIDGQARFDGEVIVNALPTADGTTNHLWQDNAASRVVKVSV